MLMHVKRLTDACKETYGCVYRDLRMHVERLNELQTHVKRPTNACKEAY